MLSRDSRPHLPRPHWPYPRASENAQIIIEPDGTVVIITKSPAPADFRVAENGEDLGTDDGYVAEIAEVHYGSDSDVGDSDVDDSEVDV